MERVRSDEWEYYYSLGIVKPSQVVASTLNTFQPFSVVWRVPLNVEVQLLKAVPHFRQIEEDVVPPANIQVFGFANPLNVGPGAILTYTIFLRNVDERAVDNIQVISALPFDFKVTNVNPSQDYIFDIKEEIVKFSGGTLNVGESAILLITGIVPQNAIESIENIVAVENSINPPTTITAKIDPTLGPDLRIFGLSVPNALAGDTIVYTFIARNDGLATATNIKIRDSLPSEFTVSEITIEEGKNFIIDEKNDVNNVVTFSGGTLQPTQSTVFTVIGSLSETATGQITNIVAIDPDNQITEKTKSNNIITIDTQISDTP